MDTVKEQMGLSVRISRRHCQLLALLMGSAMLASACDINTSTSNRLEVVAGQGSVVIDPLLALPGLRSLDREDLRLELLVNGERVETIRGADGRWSALIEVQRGIQLNLQSTISQGGLVLARSTQSAPISLEANEVQIEIPSDSYDSNFDSDNDRLSNLFELENDTNPSDSGDPGLGVIEAGIRLRFERPAALDEVDSSIAEQARLEASLNGQPIEVMADQDGFVAEATVVDASQVYVEATWFLDNPAALAVAGIKRSDSASDGATILYASTGYGLRFDDDFDGVENASEVRFQSDPTDAASRPGTPGDAPGQPDTPDDEASEPPTPVPPTEEPPTGGPDSEEPDNDEAARACAVSVFAAGCDSDFDRDGIPDSVEGRSADADEDSIPDWMESASTDADDDGTSAQLDVNEEDPCSPDANSPACVVLSSDADGDGKLDVEEGNADSDGDGKPDADESAFDDADDDGTPDEEDSDDSDPCIPRATRPFCT